jgi:hypothetical protein
MRPSLLTRFLDQSFKVHPEGLISGASGGSKNILEKNYFPA